MQVSSFGFGISSPFTEAAFLKEERQRLIRAVVLGPVPKVRPAGQGGWGSTDDGDRTHQTGTLRWCSLWMTGGAEDGKPYDFRLKGDEMEMRLI